MRLCFAIMTLALPISAHAQNCLGHRPLSDAPVNASLNLRILQQAKGPEARVRFGSALLHGGFNLGLLNVGGTNRAYNIGAQVGTTIELTKAVFVCPLASINYQPAVAENSNFPATKEVLLGASAGLARVVSTRLTLIPYAGGGYLRASLNNRDTPILEGTTQVTSVGPEIFGGVGAQFGQIFLARAEARYREYFGARTRIVVLGITIAPNRKVE